MSSSQIYQQVENGIVDVGIGYLIGRNPGMTTSVLYYDTFELVVSPAIRWPRSKQPGSRHWAPSRSSCSHRIRSAGNLSTRCWRDTVFSRW